MHPWVRHLLLTVTVCMLAGVRTASSEQSFAPAQATGAGEVRVRQSRSIMRDLGSPKSDPARGAAIGAQYDDLNKLHERYEEIFRGIAAARACGLDWQPRYDEFMRRLGERHGPDLNRDGVIGEKIDRAMEIGARVAPDCVRTGAWLPTLRLPDVPPSLVLAPGERVPPAPAQGRSSHHEPFVAPDSRIVRSLYEAPLPDDPARLIAIRKTLELAGHDHASGALGRYLDWKALAELTGEPFRPAATLDQVIDEQWATGRALDARRARIISGAVRPHLGQSPGGKEYLGDTTYLRHRSEGHGVWSTVHAASGNPYWVGLFLLIENTSGRAIFDFDVRMLVGAEARDDSRSLDCTPVLTRAQQLGLTTSRIPRFEPGQKLLYRCGTTVGPSYAAKTLEAMRRVARGVAPMKLEVSRLVFAEPQFFVYEHDISWPNEGQAEGQAVATVRAAGCADRGSCGADAKWKWQTDPRWLVLTAGVAAGAFFAVLAHLLGWSATRVILVALGLTGFGAVALIAGAGKIDGWMLVLVIVGFAFALPAFLVGLFGVLLPLRALSRRRRDPEQGRLRESPSSA